MFPQVGQNSGGVAQVNLEGEQEWAEVGADGFRWGIWEGGWGWAGVAGGQPTAYSLPHSCCHYIFLPQPSC
jgi:hypothetical protein